MAFIPVTNTLEVAIQATLAGEQCVNTFQFRRDVTWGAVDAEALCNDIASLWETFTETWLYATYVFSGVAYRGLRTASDITGVVAVAPVTGGAGAPSLPNNVAISIARVTGLAGRSFRGRVYIPVTAAENLATTNTISPTFGTACIALLNAVRDAGDADDWTHVVVSKQTGGAPRVTGVTTPITNYSIRDYVTDSMRRRLPGRGA